MKVKVFETNHNGKIEFTRAELENLLNEIYKEGYHDGESSIKPSGWTYLNNARQADSASITTTNAKIDKDALNQIAGVPYTTNNDEGTKITTATNSEKPNTYTVTMKCNEADINRAADALRELLNEPGALSTKKVDDAFSRLAKELNF